MANNEDHDTSDPNNNPINESSYHLKLVGFEDSQIDHFIPYSSPSILYWQTNKKFARNYNYNPDLSDVEKKRGNSSDLSTTKIVQIPDENSIDFQTDRKHLNINQAKSDQKIDLLNTSRIAPLSARSDLLNFDASALKEKSNLELNKSRTLAELENNVQKKLEFLDITEHDVKESVNKNGLNQDPPVIKINNADETGEILLELSCESEEEIDENEVKKDSSQSFNDKTENTIDSDIFYYKMIDQRLEEMRQKKLDLLNKENKNLKIKNSPVSWEISPSTTRLSERIKENIQVEKRVKNEVSTQTSFIQPKQKHMLDEEPKKSPLNQLRFDMTQQKKFKTMIEAQKHEKRYKELELLAKLERLQAERLKKLIMENSSDESSLAESSYFHSTTGFLDGSIGATKLESVIKKYERVDRRKSEFIRPTFSSSEGEISLVSECDFLLSSSNNMRLGSNLKKSQVEVLNLKDTTVYKQPKEVKIIKENELRKSSTESKDLKQSLKEANRIFFSDISNVKNDLKSIQSEPNLRNEASSPSFSKMSLQDAFLIFKKDLIERSQKRVQNIEERSRMRQLKSEFERKQAEVDFKFKLVEKKLMGEGKNNYQFPKKRVMTSQEIKTLTKKNYEKLPEVKKKQERERLEKEKKLNMLKSAIYKKTIQERVLTKGPNFGLNFKALKN